MENRGIKEENVKIVMGIKVNEIMFEEKSKIIVGMVDKEERIQKISKKRKIGKIKQIDKGIYKDSVQIYEEIEYERNM